MGCAAGLSTAPLTGQELRRVAIPHSLSLALRLGRAVLAARIGKADPVAAAAHTGGGRLLFQGLGSACPCMLTSLYPGGHNILNMSTDGHPGLLLLRKEGH